MGAARGYRWWPARQRQRSPGTMVGVSSTPATTDDGHSPDADVVPANVEVTGTDVVEQAPAVGDPPRSRWQRLDKKLLLASAVIAVGLVLMVVALATAVTGDEAADLPPAIESITPVYAAVQVPQQTAVIVDLAAGYEGYLVVDGVPIPTIRLDEVGRVDVEPGEQIDLPPGAIFEPGNATLSFTPGEEQAVDNFDAGPHTVTVVYWEPLDESSRARSYTWSFTTV